MFAYCTVRLGMSEDEACRRIAVAQLARRFPVLHERLAGGAISLSVAVLLKQRLTDANCAQLVRAVSGKTVARAREVLAAWFPQPDVPSSIRKLPERSRTASSNGDAASTGGGVTLARGVSARLVGSCDDERERVEGEPVAARGPCEARELKSIAREGSDGAGAVDPAPTAAAPPPLATATGVPLAGPLLSAALTLEPPSRARTRASSAIEPLSPERYKIVFTADAELKRKLELARDLLRHAVPSGDLATIVGRALDLLLDETSRRRFAKTRRSNAAPRSPLQAAGEVAPPLTTASESTPETPVEPAAAIATADGSSIARPTPAPPAPLTAPTGPLPSRHLPNSVRRTVVERDGLCCTWHGPDGTRCESRAWLEHDHIDPRGKGGGDDPSNIRLRCRAHNLLAAEQTYGRQTIANIIARRRGRQHPGVETPGDIAGAPTGSGQTP